MATKWLSDPAHCEIQFKVKHLMITTVTGYFRKFSVEVESESDDFDSASRIEFTADINSVDTNNEQRDTHLKSEDFFDATKFPQMLFKGKNYKKSGDDGELQGDLTIRGVTRPVALKLEFGGVVVDGYGQTKAGFTLQGKVSRKEYGLLWNAVTEAGNVVAGDDVKIMAEIQLIKQA